MALRIEIEKSWNGLFELREGDLTGCSTSSNITRDELISELVDMANKLNDEVRD